MTTSSQLLASIIMCTALKSAWAASAAVDQLFEKMESDVLELAREMAKAYKNRCSTSLLNCQRMNYDECSSQYPNLFCSDTELKVEPCGGPGCSSLVDTSISAVSLTREIALGRNGNPVDKQVIESVCYTKELDSYFLQKRSDDEGFWRNQYNVEPPQMFVAAQDGTFRIHPARHAANCGDFDPRSRPWYIAGSSGPKNVIIILDTSGSMEGTRLDLMKQAAIRVIETLTIADRVGIVHFASDATVVTSRLLVATAENKMTLTAEINSLGALGGTNFYDAFGDAFVMIANSVDMEINVICNSAILFLTDGQMTDPDDKDEDDVINLVTSEMTRLQSELQKPVLLFTFSISDSDEVHRFPQRLACATELGVWSQLLDESEIIQSLTSYYRLFSLGLGTDRNTNFVAWTEPYHFYPSGVLGTTASAPVYDQTKTPPLFLGVVGIAYTLSAIDQALGVGSESEATLNRIIRQSTAKCPVINLTLCELESYRGAGRCLNAANTSTLCDFVQIEASECSGTPDYPKDLWENTNLLSLDYTERACCRIGYDEPTSECAVSQDISPSGINKSVVIAGASSGGIFFLASLVLCVWCIRKRRSESKLSQERSSMSSDRNRTVGEERALPLASGDGTHDAQSNHSSEELRILPPPTGGSAYLAEQIQAYRNSHDARSAQSFEDTFAEAVNPPTDAAFVHQQIRAYHTQAQSFGSYTDTFVEAAATPIDATFVHAEIVDSISNTR